MCNPPFYSSIDEMLASAHAKSLPASSACTGTTTEMVYDQDGELGFARCILKDSVELKKRVQWYTTLFGKSASVGPFIKDLKETLGLNGNWAIAQFSQGPTQRWAVGWSFHDLRPSKNVCIPPTTGLKGCFPTSPEQTLVYDTDISLAQLKEILDELPTVGYFEDAQGPIVYEYSGNVWSRAARRSRARGKDQDGVECQFSIRISVKPGETVIRWLKGIDPVVFESFCGTLRKQIQRR